MELSEITKQFIGGRDTKNFLDISEKTIDNVLSIIVPHAGYYFSGQIASDGYKQIDKYDNVFIIGTSHKTVYKGGCLIDDDNYNELSINKEICTELINDNNLFFKDNSILVGDHNLEIQLPFVKNLLPYVKIIPIMIGDSNRNNLISISNSLKKYFNGNNLFIISSDFSHYPSHENAVKLDSEIVEKIINLDIDGFLSETEKLGYEHLVTRCCGWSSILILMNILKDENIKGKIISNRTSGDVTNGHSKVVGYYSIGFYKEKEKDILTEKDKEDLLKISRTTLTNLIKYNKIDKERLDDLSDNVKVNMGAFVTLKIDGNLRGCIGLFSPNYWLCDVVKEMTISSSTRDTRFNKVTEDELDKIKIEISVLTPFKKIDNIDEIILGKHGIYMEKNSRSGTFLPQVATETGWTKEEFLGQCSSSKMGLGWKDWKDANIYTYEAIVFDEKPKYKEAMYYMKDDNNVICNLCPHNCKLSNGQIGICTARKNINGILYSLVYNNPSITGAMDPVEKKPLRHFLPGTLTYSLSCNGCNFKCLNCQNSGISQAPLDRETNITPLDIINDCLSKGCKSISYTYTEPTIYYEYMLDIAKLAKERGIKNIMVSNGYINPKPLEELIEYMDAANIDLKVFNDDKYRKITKGSLYPVLETLKTLKDSKVWLEITNLIIPGHTDDIGEIENMYNWLFDNGFEDVPVHLIPFSPRYKMSEVPRESMETIMKVKEIAIKNGIKYVYP